MVNATEWKLWLKEKKRLEEIWDLIAEVELALGELSEASSPNGLKDAMFERRELGENNVNRVLLEEMLFNLRENITAGIAEYEKYLKDSEEEA